MSYVRLQVTYRLRIKTLHLACAFEAPLARRRSVAPPQSYTHAPRSTLAVRICYLIVAARDKCSDLPLAPSLPPRCPCARWRGGGVVLSYAGITPSVARAFVVSSTRFSAYVQRRRRGACAPMAVTRLRSEAWRKDEGAILH